MPREQSGTKISREICSRDLDYVCQKSGEWKQAPKIEFATKEGLKAVPFVSKAQDPTYMDQGKVAPTLAIRRGTNWRHRYELKTTT